ncbi:unnamed protein product [Sphagnum jensenii]
MTSQLSTYRSCRLIVIGRPSNGRFQQSLAASPVGLRWGFRMSPPTSDCLAALQAQFWQVSVLGDVGTIPALCYLKLTPRKITDPKCIVVMVAFSIMTICGFVGAFAAVFAVN